MSTPNERDLDYIAAMLDHCDRIEEILQRLDYSEEKYNQDAVFQDAVKMNIFQMIASLKMIFITL